MFDRQQSIRRTRVVDISATNFTSGEPTRTLWVGTGGTVIVQLADNPGVDVTYQNVPSGHRMPLSVIQVTRTGTTAANLIAEY